MRPAIVLLAFLTSGVAFAQSEPICQSGAADERVRCILGDLMTQNIGLAAQVQQLRAALKDAQDQAKALKDKYEPAAKPQ